MGQLEQFVDNIPSVLADIERQAEKLNARAAAVKARSDDVFGRWHEHFSGKEASLAAAEAAINRLSNVPLSGVSTEAKDDAA